jgi:steroid C-25 hydroxylase gamma subunit
MLVKKVASSSESLLDSDSPEWGKVPGKRIRMAATPLDRQPSEYVKLVGDSWDYGATTQMWVKSVHDGKAIYFLLEWEDSTQDVVLVDEAFPDGAGLLFPLKKDAPIDTMGSKEEPVNAWYWRADKENQEGGRNIRAEGLGSTQETANSRTKSRILTRARWKDGRWRLVMGRSLTVEDTAVQFEAGGDYKVGFAVWQGSNRERAGLKSFSNSWLDLELED